MNTYVNDYCISLKPNSAEQVQRSMRYFGEFLALHNLTFEALETKDICKFLEHLKQRKGLTDHAGRDKLTNATLARILFSCRAVSRLANVPEQIWERAIKLCPISDDPEKRKAGRLSGKQINNLIANLPQNRTGYVLAGFIGLAFGGALRRGEILALRMADARIIDDTLVCSLIRTKNGKNYRQAVAPKFIPIIMKLVQYRLNEGANHNDYIFTSSKGTVYNPRSINKVLGFYSEKILGFRISTHWGRYSAITKLLEDGHTYGEIKHFSRHSNIRIVERYDKREFGIHNSLAKKLSF